ncbi:MAG TPA: conserved phage C-terminal domain-containing protein [Ureibacillus sp.]|nr:conserved phage C-terminal domain-containing protein [Ureibacillus sp.]
MKEKLLIPESPLLTLPTLALKLGTKEAMILQQLHYRLLHSPYKKDGYTWYKHTYMNWHKQFPFYSEKTISRGFLNLEKKRIIVSSQVYNPAKVMKTKWYRIDYEELYRRLGMQYDPINETLVGFGQDPEVHTEISHAIQSQNDCSKNTKDSIIVGQFVPQLEDKEVPSIKEEFKEEVKKKNNIVEKNLDVVTEVIQYLNKKTNRNYRINNHTTRRFINARLKEGYKLEDFKKVINVKVKQWLHDPKMNTFLRPSTLFSPTNFENYLIESKENPTTPKKREIKPIVLDFTLGEED